MIPLILVAFALAATVAGGYWTIRAVDDWRTESKAKVGRGGTFVTGMLLAIACFILAARMIWMIARL